MSVVAQTHTYTFRYSLAPTHAHTTISTMPHRSFDVCENKYANSYSRNDCPPDRSHEIHYNFTWTFGVNIVEML